MALGRLALLKSSALLNISGTTYDNELKLLLEAVTEYVHTTACGRVLESATYTDELYSGDGSNSLYLNEWPVTTLSAVKIWDGSAYTAETVGYFATIDGMRLHYPALGQEANATYGRFPLGVNNIKVTYTAGYATTNWDSAAITASFAVPRGLEYAVCKIAALWWQDRKDGGRLGLRSATKGSEGLITEMFVAGLPADIERQLAQYRRKF